MFSDPIADMLTRIRNGYMAKKTVVAVPHSKMKEAIAAVMVNNNFLKAVETTEENKKKTLVLSLLYLNGRPAVTNIKRISKAGRKVYQKKSNLPHVLSGLGKAIVSTSVGIMTAAEAKKKSVGGEVICEIW